MWTVLAALIGIVVWARPTRSQRRQAGPIATRGRGGYLLASSQGDDTFVGYDRGPRNRAVATFAVTPRGAIDGSEECDGAMVSTAAFMFLCGANDGGALLALALRHRSRSAGPALVVLGVAVLTRRGVPTSITLALLGAVAGVAVGLGDTPQWARLGTVLAIGAAAPFAGVAAGYLLVHGTTLFVATPSELRVISAITGAVDATVRPEGVAVDAGGGRTFAGSDPSQPPLLAQVAGVPTVLVGVQVTLPGQGTTPSRKAVELIAVRAADSTRLWSAPIEIAESPQELRVAVIGVAGTVAVVQAGDSAYGLDLTTRKVVWHRDTFAAAVLVGDVVVGSLSDTDGHLRPAGIGAVDGSPRWSDKQDSSAVRVQGGGPRFVMVTGSDYGSGKGYYRVVDGRTGVDRPRGPRVGRRPVRLSHCRLRY